MSSDSEKEDLVSSIKFEDYFKPEIYEINEEAEELRQKVKEELESELEVRDFAYASKDPRHWGLKVANNDLEESDISSEDNDSEVDFSSFNQWDNGYFVPFVDIDVEKFFNGVEKSKLIEYAFEKQKQDCENDENDSHRGSQEFHKADFEKSHEEDNGSKQDLSKMKLKIYNARSLFDFRKVTEWEMSLAEGETLFLIATEDPEEEIELPDELKDEINLDPDSNPNEKEDDKKKDDEKENEDDKKESTDNKKDSVNNKDEKLKSEEEILQSSDRIGSIDELTPGEEEDDPFTILSNQYNFPHPVNVEIRPHGFYYDLLQYIDYSSVYGNGWVLGIKAKIRCRRRFKNKKRLRKRRAIKMKLRVVDIGLIPENYVEVCSDSENEL